MTAAIETRFIAIMSCERDTCCDHCGRKLTYGVVTDAMGTIGADCFVKAIKANRNRFKGNGKPSAPMIREYAVMKERSNPEALSRRGYEPHVFRFELS